MLKHFIALKPKLKTDLLLFYVKVKQNNNNSILLRILYFEIT